MNLMQDTVIHGNRDHLTGIITFDFNRNGIGIAGHLAFPALHDLMPQGRNLSACDKHGRDNLEAKALGIGRLRLNLNGLRLYLAS